MTSPRLRRRAFTLVHAGCQPPATQTPSGRFRPSHPDRVSLHGLVAACLALAGTARAQEEAPTVAATGMLAVLNKADGDVWFVDPRTGETHARIEVGIGPHEAATTPDGRTVVVCNYGDQTPGNTLSVVDVASARVVRTISLGRHARPHGIQFLPDGKRVVVTCEVEKCILVVDVSEGEVLASHATDQEVSHMVALSPDGGRAWVTNIGSGSLTGVDLATGKHLGNVSTNRGAEGIAVHPTKDEVWVSNRAAHTVSVVDTETMQEVTELKATTFPIRVAFTPDGKHALVSCAQSGEVAVFDTETREEVKRVSMRGADGEPAASGQGPLPVGILVEPSGRLAFVANMFSNQVTVLDLQDWRVVRRIPTGRQPDGMTWIPRRQVVR